MTGTGNASSRATLLRVLRFLLVGGLNTGVTFVIYLGLCRLLPAWVSYGAAYAIGIAISYHGNRYFVFRVDGEGPPRSAYVLLHLILLSLGSGTTALCIGLFSATPAWAGFVALVLVTALSYGLNHLYFSRFARPAP